LGNAFLSHVRAVDGIFQVVRAFDDAEVIHVEGEVEPLRDMQIISTELRLKDIEWVEKDLDRLRKGSKNLGSISLADKAKKEEMVSNVDGNETRGGDADAGAEYRGEGTEMLDGRE